MLNATTVYWVTRSTSTRIKPNSIASHKPYHNHKITEQEQMESFYGRDYRTVGNKHFFTDLVYCSHNLYSAFSNIHPPQYLPICTSRSWEIKIDLKNQQRLIYRQRLWLYK